ncbi:MAG TPA: polysaccharide biosynthesis/export family protein [Pyrinomonadaceae bacterium]|nr:polysaccharide biosynthesis/export family protein [Pyrinomonadaceae bacterium]
MKQVVFCLLLLTIAPAIISAQTQTRQRLSSEQSTRNEQDAARTRVVGPKVANHVEGPKLRPNAGPATGSAARSNTFTWGNIPIAEQPARVAAAPNNSSATVAQPPAPKLVQPTVLAVKGPTESVIVPVTSPRSAPPANYIVGAGDVLDISLANTTSRESTLFTVFNNGTIDYPLLNGPVAVAGLTTDQISGLLAAQIKVIKTPKLKVSVRDYASHTVIISGLVDSAGKKVLRRESMPLYAILTEASVRPEAYSVTILHNGKEGAPLSLKDELAMSTLVYSGDAIKISGGNATPGQYVYVGGDVAAPGEKTLRPGMTLTQVLLSAGADLSSKRIAKIARRDEGGLLSTVEYDVKSIAQGKIPDPQIVAGDRIEVRRGL